MRRAHRQENETFLLIKAMCINNLLKIKWEPRVTIQGGIQTHCSQNQEDYDNVTDQIFRSHDEMCQTQRWVSLKSCRVLLEDCSDVSAAPSWPGSPSPVCVCIPAKVHSRKKKSIRAQRSSRLNERHCDFECKHKYFGNTTCKWVTKSVIDIM